MLFKIAQWKQVSLSGYAKSFICHAGSSPTALGDDIYESNVKKKRLK